MRLRHEAGQSLILLAVAMMVLMGMLALTLDGGLLMVMRRYMQNAADAAAIAGAREVALRNTEEAIRVQLRTYATAPHVEPEFEAVYYPNREPLTGTGFRPADATGVVVTTTVEFPSLFAGLLGLETLRTGANSAAVFGIPAEVGGLWPVTVDWDDIFPGCPSYREDCVPQDAIYMLQDPAGPGGFHWLDWDGPPVSSQELADNIENPDNSGLISVDSWVGSGPGTMGVSNGVLGAIRSWIDNYGNVPITITITDETDASGSNLKYHVAGFASVVVSGFDYGPGQKQYGACDVPDDYVPPGGLCGTFVRKVANTTTTTATGGDYGVYSVRIVRP